MLRKFLNSQVAYVQITERHLDSMEEYLLVDGEILEAAQIMPGEIAEGRAESRAVVAYGSLGGFLELNDRLILRTYAYVESARALTHESIRCRVNEENEVIEASRHSLKWSVEE